MVLPINYKPPFEPDRNQDRESLAGLNQTISGIGDDWQKYGERQKQLSMRQTLVDLEKQRAAREQAEWDRNYSGTLPLEGDQRQGSIDMTPNGTTSWNPSPLDMGRQSFAQAPSYDSGMQAPAQSQYASAGTPDTGSSMPQAMHHPNADLTGHFNAWKQQGGGLYNHPEMSGQMSDPNNPMSQWNRYAATPGAHNRSERMLFDKEQSALRLQASEAAKNQATADWYKQGRPGSSTQRPDKAPPGYRWSADGQSLELIPGGPAAGKASDAAAKAQAAQDSQNAEAQMIIQKVNTALGKVSFASAGIGSYTSGVPGSPASDLAADIDSIVSNLGLSKLMEMKTNSKAGASGLGALSDREMTLLTSSIASLKQSQSQEQLRKHLNDVKTHYQNFLKMSQGINPYEQHSAPDVGQGGGGVGGGGQPTTVQRRGADGQIYDYTLNPETGEYE